jgi:hypothetical protein
MEILIHRMESERLLRPRLAVATSMESIGLNLFLKVPLNYWFSMDLCHVGPSPDWMGSRVSVGKGIGGLVSNPGSGLSWWGPVAAEDGTAGTTNHTAEPLT